MTEGHTESLRFKSASSDAFVNRYRGRFAPSPSGPLHFGSLVTALASFLDAQAHQGEWLVRIEDIDPPRAQPDAAEAILTSLETHHLHWDGSILYQHERYEAYENCLRELQEKKWLYACDCSRQDLQLTQGIYQGHCRTRQELVKPPYALRLKLYDLPHHSSDEIFEFQDLIQGHTKQHLRTEMGDQILKRRDGFYAYQLAVVVDDIAQGITHVVRGQDLLSVTASQIFFFELLKSKPPVYAHLPLALMPNQQKLSKQNLAPAINNELAQENIWKALCFLGQEPPPELQACSLSELMGWAKNHWHLQKIPAANRVVAV